MNDEYFMSIALRLAYRSIGKVAPNPAVGCVIVKDNNIISRGWTQPGGRPHAESVAIDRSRKSLKGTILYVTLEPCVHHGNTSPCAELIIKSGITRVVVSTQDPDKRVNGKGIIKLKEHGIKVKYGVCEKEAKDLNIGYLYNKFLNRPYVTLKLATTADGKIATKTGESKWITNETARKFGHKLRAQNDAVMIGSGTLIADNPLLNCRLPGLENYSPIKIIVDNKRKLNNSHLVLRDKEVLTFTNEKIHPLHQCIKSKKLRNGYVNILSEIKYIANYGITRLLIEGGGKLASSLLKDNIVDQIIWIRSNTIAGNDAISAIHDLNLYQVSELYKLKLNEIRKIYDCQIEILKKSYSPLI
ncbi:MAG: bifunctional diaminohydroxyphosphoribosylaminopyrimidine deaminase/5-amino-6-(5-phosphoribosylamino)uracil reductase RibD [Rickettsiaceae bacterium H1]|nr:bifunctional diaminohydroxyphosphoribosylaminopyrimidine deaminase/5-amino-6-(5-phosphoribosylamino)uracil reductase RibD [Rickettsiaceae bacterium H1]